MKLALLDIKIFRIPLPEPIEAAAAGVMSGFDMVMVRATDDQGATGTGYTVMHQGQGVAVAEIIKNVFHDLLIGEDPRFIEGHWQRLWHAHHYAGRGAPLSFAIAAVDTALWDLRGHSLGEPLWRLLGGNNPKVKAYAGNIDLNFPVEKLLEGASHSLENGHRSVKMRLGKPNLMDDVTRVAAMREHLDDAVELMADANEAWRVDQAVQALNELQPFGLVWLEEPITPDDYAGYRHLRQLGKIPLASGENLHTVAEFVQLIGAQGVDFPEPDMSTCGGITPFMKIAHLAEANNLPVISHGVHDVHIHLLAACPNAAYLEMHAFGLEKYMAEPLIVVDGYATAPDRPGHGIDFDLAGMAVYELD
jgi:L-alanine-DL-glutamate epimerase-like enolase superfamily enzyme|tara:strand:+ start:1410 stop:2498 length:1089 start_codon:yes stop_codon:yes gene_type:complete